MLVGIAVSSLFLAVNSQAVVNCTGYKPLQNAASTPETDEPRFLNLSKVIENPDNTFTVAQVKVMLNDFIATLSCESQLEVERLKNEANNISSAAQSIYLEKIKPITDNGSLLYAQAPEQIDEVLKAIEDPKIYDELHDIFGDVYGLLD